MSNALKKHWPEYLMEAIELGLFMFSACGFTVLLFHPSSPIAQNIHDGMLRRLLMGMAMSSTAIAIIFSPLGKRSGVHFNPSVTWTFFRLGKIEANGIALFDAKGNPISGDITDQFYLWNAGTEKDEEIGIGPNQGPRQKGPNTGDDERGVVHRVNDARWAGRNTEYFRITITPEAGM